MSKFLRTYELTVQGRSGKSYTFGMPITCIFDILHRTTGTLNGGHFMLYNLAPSVRGDIRYDNAIDQISPQGLAFEFSAGYVTEGYQPVICQGNVTKAFSYRDGPDVITEIQVLDGAAAAQQAQVELSMSFPWQPAGAFTQLVKVMNPYGVKLGVLGSIVTQMQSTRGSTWIGAAWDMVKRLAGNNKGYACIHLQKVYVMGMGDALVVPAAIPQIDSSTGLIGTPRRSGYIIDAEMLFEPRIQLLQSVKLKSTVDPSLNGQYSVQAIGHRGTMSGAIDGGVVTSLNLFGPPTGLTMVAGQ